MIYIYKLSDPRTGEPRYVGKTNDPKVRRKTHCSMRSSTTCSVWIWKLRDLGLRPEIGVLEEMPDGSRWQTREQYWIDTLRGQGADLLNSAPAGAGPPMPHVVSQETREKLRQRFKGRPILPEQRAMISKTLTGKKQSPETIAKREASRQANRLLAGKPVGPKYTPEYRRMLRRLAGAPIRGSREWKDQIAITLKTRFASLPPEEQERIRANGRGRESKRKGSKQVPTEQQRLNHKWAIRAVMAKLTPEQKLQHMSAAFAANPNHQRAEASLP